MADLNFEARIAPRKGILHDFVETFTAGMGAVAIEDSQTHKIAIILYELKPCFKRLSRYKGKEIHWEIDQFGMLTKLQSMRSDEANGISTM